VTARARTGADRLSASVAVVPLVLAEVALFFFPAWGLGRLLGGDLEVGSAGENAVLGVLLTAFLIACLASARLPLLIGRSFEEVERMESDPVRYLDSISGLTFVPASHAVTAVLADSAGGQDPIPSGAGGESPRLVPTFVPLHPLGRNLALVAALAVYAVTTGTGSSRESPDAAPEPWRAAQSDVAVPPDWFTPAWTIVLGCAVAAGLLVVWAAMLVRSRRDAGPPPRHLLLGLAVFCLIVATSFSADIEVDGVDWSWPEVAMLLGYYAGSVAIAARRWWWLLAVLVAMIVSLIVGVAPPEDDPALLLGLVAGGLMIATVAWRYTRGGARLVPVHADLSARLNKLVLGLVAAKWLLGGLIAALWGSQLLS